MRHLPPAATIQLARGVDQLLLETLSTLFAAPLDERQRAQAQFNVNRGGLGLRSRELFVAPAAFLGSWAQCYSEVSMATGWSLPANLADCPPGTIPGDMAGAVGAIRAQGVAAAEQLLDDDRWAAYRLSPALHLQRSLSQALLGVARTRWLNHADPVAAANLHSHSGWSAGAALLYPLSELALQLPDATMSVAIRERLGLARAG